MLGGWHDDTDEPWCDVTEEIVHSRCLMQLRKLPLGILSKVRILSRDQRIKVVVNSSKVRRLVAV